MDVDTLIKNLIDSLDYAAAKNVLENELAKFPNNTELLDTYAEVLTNLGEAETAEKILRKSIELQPDSNPEKYMLLGQMTNYKETLTLYTKAYELFDNEFKNNSSELTKEKGASCVASIAELYMQTDLCDEPQAESTCEEYIFQALKISGENIDAWIQLSNLRIIQGNNEAALECAERVFTQIKPHLGLTLKRQRRQL